jgi:hypothetical protein
MSTKSLTTKRKLPPIVRDSFLAYTLLGFGIVNKE